MESEGDLASWAYILLLSNPWRIVVEKDCGAASDPQAPVDPPRPGEMEQSCGGSVEFGQWAC